MKKSDKYVKTRGQRIAFLQTNAQPVAQLSSSKPQKQSSRSPDNINPKRSPIKRGRKPGYKKSKKIVKIQTAKIKLKKEKQKKKKLIKKYKIKLQNDNHNDHAPKKRGRKTKLVKQQVQIKLEGSKLNEKNQPSNQKSQTYKKFQIKIGENIQMPNQFLPKTRGQKPQQSPYVIKEEPKTENMQSKTTSKSGQNIKIEQKGSKSKITIANQDSPSPFNHNVPKIESQPAQKKKGRPKKIIQPKIGSKIQERTFDQQKNLQSFVQNAIKLRKLKNQRQFFESFSRIIEYMRQSWQYGELSKMLKRLPQPQDVLKVGIQIARGIRKQLQIQALTQYC